MAKIFDDSDGVWRTIGGRRVFIRTGQSLASAMIESGKFKNLRSDYRKAKEEDEKKKEKLTDSDEDKEIRGRMEELQREIDSGRNNKEKTERLKEELQQYKDKYEVDNEKEEKANEVVKNISSSDTIDELMNADTGDWNNMNQAERDKTCENILNDYEEKYGDRLKDEKFRKEVLDGLEDQNFHTMGKIIEQKYGNSDDLSDLSTKEKELMASIKKEESERLEIAKEIAKEVYGLNEKNASPERIEKEAKKILEPQEGEVLEKGDQPFTNSNGELERSTNYLKEWQKELKQTSDNFVQKSTSPFYPDREYTQEEIKKMEETGTRPMKNTYGGYGWEGVNSDKNLSTSEQAKAITDEMKKQYPDVKIARKSDVYSGGSSITFSVMSSDKDLYVSDSDIDKMQFSDFGHLTSSLGFERWANDNVPNYKQEHTYRIEDVRKYAKEDMLNLKKGDNQSVRGDEWYLSDYGKKVITELNKQANSYTYDDSDAMTDYFNHGTYMWVNIGKWDKPYQVNSKINDSLRRKGYQKYLKEHPASKLTFEQFKDMNSK